MKKRFLLKKHSVLDTKTGLEWERKESGPMPWQAAMDYAAAKGKGWRMPTVEELFPLINFLKKTPASDFPGMPSVRFWSSSPYVYYVNYAWGVYFDGGVVSDDTKNSAGYVRCVRGGP
jgi:hypothetical protein